ncbi:glucuronate isomerase [Cellulomonas persica]|uniref:Uronate isomerase n=1 Tax=Cellulomonas persica TaxID=76861 RepID=A0A510UV78_9CELL|nr:glucuronate isomerase [Cellulomonas persica]GEK17040.1 uronate isomerase [Cellulomonas persica]
MPRSALTPADQLPTLALHPDRALPADPGVRSIARELLATTQDLPLVSMHGHVDADLLLDDEPFTDPASLLVTPDHYLLRLLVSQGVDLDSLGVPRNDDEAVETDPREIWRTVASHWHVLRGTPTRFWLEHELVDLFGITLRPSAHTADVTFDQMVAALATPELRPRALFERFGLEILATTDDATATLDSHARLADAGLSGRVIPTFRPDALLHPLTPGWGERVERLGELTGTTISTSTTFVEALARRRAEFVARGALATDHGLATPWAEQLPDDAADRLMAAALRSAAGGPALGSAGARALAGHLLFEMARLSCDDGLVMQLHPGVLRDYDARVAALRGPDVGYDIPVVTEFVHGLRPILEAFGHHPRFRLVVFTVDEDTYSRELAPLAGVYPALRLGAPWWFLDTPDAMRRFREAVTDTAGFYNTTGFVDDTRAFCSIPARHDLARRIDAGFLARLVAEHRLDLDEAHETAVDLAYRLPLSSYARPS